MIYHPKRHERHRSIFIRLLMVLLATMGLVHLVIGGAFGLISGTGSQKYIESNIHHYAESIVRDIGVPPDTTKARDLSDRYLLYIRFESERFQWSSHAEMPGKFKGPGPCSMWRKPIVIQNEDGSRYTLIWRFGPFMGMYRTILIGLIVIVTLIFFGTHGYLRHILKPIQWLRKGVDEISSGNLNVQIPKKRSDELGRLTDAFNDMVQRFKAMLKSRDQLLLDVSHELRSPLTRIKIALEFIKDSEKKKDILSDIAEIETKIAEILETERLNTEHGQLNLLNTDIVQLIKSVLEDYQDKPPGIRADRLLESLMIPLDTERIRMVLKNVFQNAVKFSRARSRPVKVSMETSDDMVIIQIRDDGIGIPQDQLPFLFEPFFRADASRSKASGGYGLGLHLCKKIMEAHGGSIRIHNNESGKGTTVMLEFKTGLSSS